MDIPQIFETKRLILRSYNKRDFDTFSELMSLDDIANSYFIPKEQKTNEGAKTLFNSIIKSHDSSNQIFAFMVTDKENENSIGSCGIKLLKESIGATCFYILFPKYRGNGYAIEAMLKLLEFAFSVLAIPKLIAYINQKHSRSWKVAERIGMKYMGHVQYKHFTPKPMHFIIERNEYEAQRSY